MTAEQSAAFVNAQAALLNAAIAGLTAANMQRAALGHSMAYSEDAFLATVRDFESTLEHNAVITLFGEST